MAKRHTFRKTEPDKPIPATARELESFMLGHNSKFNSRDYDKFERMKLACFPVRDTINELKAYSSGTLTQHLGVQL